MISNANLLARHYVASAQRYYKRRTIIDMTPVRRNFYRLFWQAAADDLGAMVEPLGDDILRITKDKRSTIVKDHLVSVDTYLNRELADKKPFINRLLDELSYPTPDSLEYKLTDISKAWEFCLQKDGPFVVKPSEGSGGVGVTAGVTSKETLLRASIAGSASIYMPTLVVETQVPGESYRLLYLGGELIDVLERRRPTIAPDGVKSIRELINDENMRRREGVEHLALNVLSIDLDCDFHLAANRLSLASVPNQQSERLSVKNACNENNSFDNSAVMDKVHPSFRTLGREIYAALGGHLIGLDVMTRDISVPLREAGGAINEVNIPPGLHYHSLIDNPGQKVDVGTAVLDFIFRNPLLSCPPN